MWTEGTAYDAFIGRWSRPVAMQLVDRLGVRPGAAWLDPGAAELDEGRRFPLCQPDRLATLLASAGAAAVDTRAIDVATPLASFDDYWAPFLGGQGPAPSYVAGLTPARRDALRDRLRADLPAASDGSIQLCAGAWAVRGVRP